MKLTQNYILICLILISCRDNSSSDLGESFSQDFVIDSNLHCTDIIDDWNHYDTMCQCIEENDLIFPTKNVVSGKIYKNSAQLGEEFKTESINEVDTKFIESLRKITADSSNFIWGEVGTPYEDYRLEFYNAEGVFINSATVSLDGMIWIYPYLGTTKWGGLSHKGDTDLRKLLNEYVEN